MKTTNSSRMQWRRMAGVFVAAALAVPPQALAQETPPVPPAEAPPAAPEQAPPVEAPAARQGIRGKITDGKTGEGLIEATVKVVKGGKGQTLTDVDGNFELALPPGEYELRVFYELYEGRRIADVSVSKGQWQNIDVALSAEKDAVIEVKVEGKADPKSENANLQARRKSAVVQDTVSAQEIARSPDSNAGDAVKRVVSATVVEGKYVYVRGLGGRYSITLLNGVPLPSPDPDNPAVPLDIFPTSLLANLTVVKSYNADLPGTFSGGALLIETSSYPEELELKLKLSSAFDTESTFRDRLTYQGGAYDYLGFDDGTRALPEVVPRGMKVDSLSSEENTTVARSLRNIWALERDTALPPLGITGSVGDTSTLRSGRKLGWLATAQYGNKMVTRRYQVARNAISNGEQVPYDETTIEEGVGAVSWGALGNVGLELSKTSSLNLFTLFSRTAEDRGLFEADYSDSLGGEYEKSRLYYQARQLSFTQLAGRHEFPAASDLELRWQGHVALTGRDEPDTRDLYYQFTPDRYFIETANSGERQYADLEDVQLGGSTDASLPISRFVLKAGAGAQNNQRDYQRRRLAYDFYGSDYRLLSLDAETMLAPSNMGREFKLIDRTQDDDGFSASRTVLWGYLAGEVKIIEPLRVVAGARLESSQQSVEIGNDALPNEMGVTVDRDDNDILPGGSVIYSFSERQNVRIGYSRTLARPQFRELSPVLFYDFTRRRSVTGTATLVNTHIQNADVRWELFPGDREVLAVSGFYKKFKDPIELYVTHPDGSVRYLNTGQPIIDGEDAFDTDGADVYGLELEARAGFGRLSRSLDHLRGAFNMTLADSEIDLGDRPGSATSPRRPLQGQSPVTINADLSWADEDEGIEVSALYNVQGRRLAEVGLNMAPDVYEETFHRVDVSASFKLQPEWKLKLTGQNLLNQKVVLTQGPVDIRRYAPGLLVGLSLEWAPKL